jgi:hypothetical protein
MAKSYVPYGDGLQQTKRVNERGGMQEYVISAGGNYMEKLMIGGTIGIMRTKHNRTFQFQEDDLSGRLDNDFRYMRLTETLQSVGTGINLKLGAIFKPSDAFRLGLAFHTPTVIYMNDLSRIEMESHTDSLKIRNNPGANPITRYTQDTALIFNYQLQTPYKAIASASVLFNKYGFLTADVEYVDYRSMKFDFGGIYFNEANTMNQVIRNRFQNTFNIRVGGEVKIGDMGIRAGVVHYGTPFIDKNNNAARTIISGGVGYRAEHWFMDIALAYSMMKLQEMPYYVARPNANVLPATIQQNITGVTMTVARRF